jgi:hypothetical protein
MLKKLTSGENTHLPIKEEDSEEDEDDDIDEDS